MGTFTNAIIEAKEWKFKSYVKDDVLHVMNKSERVLMRISNQGEILWASSGYDTSSKEIASKVNKSESITNDIAKKKYVDQTKVFGTLDWLYSGMNAE